jgi:hypothetical protein
MSTAFLDYPQTAEQADDEAQYWDLESAYSAADPAYFVDQYGVIDKPKAPLLGDVEQADELARDDEVRTASSTVRFRLWPEQAELMATLVTERLVLILKARQLGISWLVCAYALWLALFHANQAIYLFSRRHKDAKEMIRRIKAMYHRLPGPLRDRITRIGDKDNVSEIVFVNGSRIESMPDTKDSGVGNTASLIVLDEWARTRYGAILFEQVRPAMEAGGQMIILSTANGMANWFHEMWNQAVSGIMTFCTVFLPWWARPGRNAEWYENERRNSNDPNKFKENYPSTPIEAFRASGNVRFAHEWIEAQADNVQPGLPPHEWPGSLRGIPGLKVYKPPEYNRRYVIAADVAEGKETSNYDAAVVLDADSFEEVASLHGQWEPDVFALWLIALGKTYVGRHRLPGVRNEYDPRSWEERPATIIPERNNHGHAVLVTLKMQGYAWVGNGHDGDPGWLTNSKTKPEMIDLLARMLRENLITVRSAAAVNEFSVYKRLKKGTTGAEPPYFDDIVMAWSIALAWLQQQLLVREDRTMTVIANPLADYRG